MHQILLYFLPQSDKSLCCCVPVPGVRMLICSEQPQSWDFHPHSCSCPQESLFSLAWSLQSWVMLWELLILHPIHCRVSVCLWTPQIQAQKARSSENMGFSFQLRMAVRARTVKLAVFLCWFQINKHQKLLKLSAHLLSVIFQQFCFTDMWPCLFCSPSVESWDGIMWPLSGLVHLFIL